MRLRTEKIPLPSRTFRIGITGSPGTGKRSVGKELARLTGLEFFSLNDFAIDRGMGKWQEGEFEVDVAKLRKEVCTDGKIVVGHLLPYVVRQHDLDFVAVLRCSPRVLIRRYSRRGYSRRKSQENVESEILDIIPTDTLKVFGRKKVSEFDTTRTKRAKTTAIRILETIQGKRPKRFGVEANWIRRANSVHGFLTSFQADIVRSNGHRKG